jgi:ABC-type nitrate/sulfonate/bicarbonate transport system ATPase subunit
MKISISKSYGEKTVFENLAFEIADGEVTCILGASGVGKTTLLNAMAGLIDFQGKIEPKPECVGYIFQEPRLLNNLSVRENLLYAGGKEEEMDKLLEKVGLLAHKNKRPNQLSGGEKQRVAIARAFLSNTPLLLLDEPFSSLDTALKIKLCKVFADIWQEKKPTAVLVTHDLEDALMLGHRILVLKQGKIAADFAIERTEYPMQYGKEHPIRAQILQEILKEEIKK